MEYPEIRRVLRRYLHQDFDLESKNVARAITCSIEAADLVRLVAELEDLRHEPIERVKEVLNDHEVHIWDDVEPHELLVTLLTLAKLAR